MTIYFLRDPESQKAHNLARDNRLSLTIDHDVSDPMAITGLSMAAHAHPVTDSVELAKAMGLLVHRYPEYAQFPMPKPALRGISIPARYFGFLIENDTVLGSGWADSRLRGLCGQIP